VQLQCCVQGERLGWEPSVLTIEDSAGLFIGIDDKSVHWGSEHKAVRPDGDPEWRLWL